MIMQCDILDEYPNRVRQQKKINKVRWPKRKPKGAVTSLDECCVIVECILEWTVWKWWSSFYLIANLCICLMDCHTLLLLTYAGNSMDKCCQKKVVPYLRKLHQLSRCWKLFELLSCANVCAGLPKFVRMLNAKHGKLQSSDRGCSAYYASIQLSGDTHSQTVRSSSCEMLSKGPKCPSCVEYRLPLRSAYNRWNKSTLRTLRQLPATHSHIWKHLKRRGGIPY